MTFNSSIEESETQIGDVEVIEPTVGSSVAVDSSYKIEFIYGETPKINICFAAEEPKRQDQNASEISEISFESPVKTRDKSAEKKQKNLISILKKVTDKKLEKSPNRKSVNFLLPPSPTPVRTSPRISEKLAIANTFLLTQKFFIVIESYFTSYIKNLKWLNDAHPLLRRAFNWIKTIDVYLKLLEQSIMMPKKRQSDSASGSSESGTKTKKSVSSGEEYSKKLHRKLVDNRSLIMQSDRNKCTIEKDCSYAYNYLERVKKTLAENGDDELYAELMAVLTSFDPEIESVPELYRVSHAKTFP